MHSIKPSANNGTGTVASLVAGPVECVPCGHGYAQGLEQQTACVACATGTYADTVGLAACKKCQAGR